MKEKTKVKRGELLGNPGFEQYTEKSKIEDRNISRNWRFNGGMPTKATIIVDKEQAHSGNVCVKLEQEGQGDGAIYQQNIPVNFQKKYKYTIWAKGIGELKLFIYQGGNGGFLFSVVPGTFDLTDEWKEYTCIYIPSSSIVTHASVAIHFIGEIYVDDVSFKEVEDEN